MKSFLAALALPVAGILSLSSWSEPPPDPACCYFSAMDKDVTQPGQKAFLTFDPVEKVMSFTVQPSFAGNAEDFGMVVPTPSRPRLQEVHRDFFKCLAVFTILKPMNVQKFKGFLRTRGVAFGTGPGAGRGWTSPEAKRDVRVLEAGVVGSLDYKILEASNANALFEWLKSNGYRYAGDEATLRHYVDKGWNFTVMKIDPRQMRREGDGRYKGEVTPTRFTFESERLIYPLRITKLSVKDHTEALFYVAAPQKMDLPERFSYQPSFQTMWRTAFQWADQDLCSDGERAWWKHVEPRTGEIQRLLRAHQSRFSKLPLPSLEYAHRLTAADLSVLSGEVPFDREAPKEDVAKLALLGGILRRDSYLTKCRVTFAKDAMTEDLEFRPAAFLDRSDDVEHIEILPTSPP